MPNLESLKNSYKLVQVVSKGLKRIKSKLKKRIKTLNSRRMKKVLKKLPLKVNRKSKSLCRIHWSKNNVS